jgi:hypothetical protein
MRSAALILLSIAPLCAQGLLPDWEVKKQMETVNQTMARFEPLLKQIAPQDWVTLKGASPTYVKQHEALLTEIGYLNTSTKTLAERPNRMTAALDSYLRMQAIETRMNSLIEGIRKYQSNATAELFEGLLVETAASREIIRQHLTELVAEREQEYDALEREAQRCRLQTAAPASKKK